MRVELEWDLSTVEGDYLSAPTSALLPDNEVEVGDRIVIGDGAAIVWAEVLELTDEEIELMILLR
jgi:hypothetical protein